jgi:hypothetical protein
VARVRLVLQVRQRQRDYRYVEGGQVRVLPEVRLRTWIDLTHLRPGGSLWIEQADIDTGAALGLVPERIWRQIDPSRLQPLPPPAGWSPTPLVVAGGRYGYHLAQITIGLRGENEAGRVVRFPGGPWITQLLHDGGAWRDNPVLGLTAGVFDWFWLWMHPLTESFHRTRYPSDADGVHRHDWWIGRANAS